MKKMLGSIIVLTLLAIAGGSARAAVYEDETFTGKASGNNGGAINNNETSTVINCIFNSNSALQYGGAIYNTAILTINGSSFNSNTAQYFGGAIGNVNGGNLTINDSIFENNTAVNGIRDNTHGGAIYNRTGSYVYINNSDFINNSAFSGGAIANGNEMTPNEGFKSADGGYVEINGGLFKGNSAIRNPSRGGYGGAFYNLNGTWKIDGGTVFEENTASHGGGAIWSEIGNNNDVNITIGDNVKFYGNTATSGRGGAVSNWANNYSTAQTSVLNIGNNVEFHNNKAGGGFAGALLHLTDGWSTPINHALNIGENVSFVNNSATSSGGAIYNVANGGSETVNHFNIGQGSLFDGNTSGANGGAIFQVGNGSVSVDNVINISDNVSFVNNHADLNGGAIYNRVSGGATDVKSEINLTTAGGTILFANNTDSTGLNDIYLQGNNSTINIHGSQGKVVFESGIANDAALAANAQIRHLGQNELVLGSADDPDVQSQFSTFTGTFKSDGGGTTTVYADNFFGGENYFSNNSTLNLFRDTNAMSIGHLSLDSANINSMNGTITAYSFGNFHANGVNNFSVDIDGDAGTSDTFKIENGEGTGTLNVDNFNIMSAPTAQSIDLQIFDGDISGYTFTSSGTKVTTPIYIYNVESLEDGAYRLFRSGGGGFDGGGSGGGEFNPQASRGPASTIAQHYGQLASNGILFDKVLIDSQIYGMRFAQEAKNRYALAEPEENKKTLAPYTVGIMKQRYAADKGILWGKTYGTFETLHLNHGLNIKNNNYGVIVGADMPMTRLENGWKFFPTAYLGYSGGNQGFYGVNSYQNGGQVGFMGTFIKRDFIGALIAYGGLYKNEMSVAGVTDRSGNWFGGAAFKGAYNLMGPCHFTVQPNIMAAWNVFGGQDFKSDFGAMSMDSGMLNGFNIAPGVNIIHSREDLNLYLKLNYMFNIMDGVKAKAGDVELPEIKMNQGYFEYGFGASKIFKDRLSSYAQILFRSGGRTGIGFRVGLTWRL